MHTVERLASSGCWKRKKKVACELFLVSVIFRLRRCRRWRWQRHMACHRLHSGGWDTNVRLELIRNAG